MRIGKRLVGLKIEDENNPIVPKLKVTTFYHLEHDRDQNGNFLEKIKQEIIYRFELSRNLTEFNQVAKKDKRFYPVFKKWLGMRNMCQYNLYELLIIGIVLQNTTVRRSAQMLDALLEKFGTKMIFDNKEIWAIWLPEDLKNVTEEELRSLKVGYRAKIIKRVTQDFIEGKVEEFRLRKLDKESAKKELMKLYGVGPETARILLFEALHHYDTFEHIAPWQQKIYSRLFYNKPLVSVEKINRDIKKLYGKYSMLTVHYIWEDIFWRRKNENIPWLEKEIRL
jgi:3-methyladenine DNA glycosylase/8-oxoguanine DNA glycosylase